MFRKKVGVLTQWTFFYQAGILLDRISTLKFISYSNTIPCSSVSERAFVVQIHEL